MGGYRGYSAENPNASKIGKQEPFFRVNFAADKIEESGRYRLEHVPSPNTPATPTYPPPLADGGVGKTNTDSSLLNIEILSRNGFVRERLVILMQNLEREFSYIHLFLTDFGKGGGSPVYIFCV